MSRDPLREGIMLTASEVEGVAPTAEWSRWIASGRAPASEDGNGFRTNWRDDLALLASTGVTEIAITLEWSRLWPQPDRPDGAEVEFRRDLLAQLRELGIKPWAVLVDGTLPGWFADDEGGFVDDRSRGLIWPRHVDWIGEHFGDLVDGWIPQREPLQWALWGHLLGATPPGKQRRRDLMKAVPAALDADLQAWRLLQGSAPVAVSHTARSFYNTANDVPSKPYAQWLDQTVNGQWITWMSDGEAREAFDRVLLQLRPAVEVDGEGVWTPRFEPANIESRLDPLHRMVDCIFDRDLIACSDLAGFPVDGATRTEALAALRTGAHDAGVDGWWQTSPIDGWHWQHGFSANPGLFDRDRARR